MSQSSYKFKNLVFEGGGVLGIAYAGALAVLEEEGILQQIERVAGTSVGAITSLGVALRYNAHDLNKILSELDIKKFLSKPDPIKLHHFYGWYNTLPISEWLQELIALAGSNLPDKPKLNGTETFQQLSDYGMLDLHVFATNLNLRKSIEFSVDHTPDIRVLDAILASIAIPLFFQAFQFPNGGMQNHIFVDGGLLINYPIGTFDELTANAETLGFRFERRQKYASNELRYGQMRNWAQNIYEIVKNIQSEHLRHKPQDYKRTVSIDVDTISVTEFDLSMPDRMWLMESGRVATKFYLQRYRNKNRLHYKLLHLLRLVR